MTDDPRLDQTLTLRSGRRLGFAEVGHETGIPVIYCHGFPASRLESRFVESAALRLGARVIAPDRPGYGKSDFLKERSIASWAEDVAELAEFLNIPQIYVLGVSGGGPYGLALAAKLPGRVTATAIVCGLGPVWRPEVTASMRWPGRWSFDSARTLPQLNRLFYGGVLGRLLSRRPDLALALLNVGIPEADRAALGQPANRAIVSASIQEGLRPGTRGALLDFALYTRPWDFELAGIACPISFWHGDIDATVPPDHSRIIADSLPRAMVHNFPGEGHFSLPINRSQEILRALLNC